MSTVVVLNFKGERNLIGVIKSCVADGWMEYDTMCWVRTADDKGQNVKEYGCLVGCRIKENLVGQDCAGGD